MELFAGNVNLTLSAPAIYKGDSVSFTITASGDDVEFPNVTDIEGFVITRTGSSSQTSIINGKVNKTISKTYSFTPTKDVTIPSLNVKVDGATLKTNPKKVSVIKPQASKSGDPFIVELKVDKTNLKVGESTTLNILFKQRLDAKANKLNINEPKIDNFWIKKVDGEKQFSQGQYIVTQYSYLIFAQKAGEFEISPIQADIGRLTQRSMGGFFSDPFFNSMSAQINWQKIYSNSLQIKVDALPNGIELYGDFNIKATVDKKEVFVNKPVNLTIDIDGVGNIDDIQKFDINLANAIVYPDKPQISSRLVNGEYQGSFTQKIAIISDSDFKIPSIKLTFFDKKTNKIKTISTDTIDIKVKGKSTLSQNEPIVQTLTPNNVQEKPKTKVIVKQSKELNYLFLLVGLILGSSITYFIMNRKNSEDKIKENDLVTLIKNTKDDKKLFEILLPYAKDDEVISDILKQLEENIYKKTNHKIDKQKLYDVFLIE
jgi:Flp pilus assembly protein TadG